MYPIRPIPNAIVKYAMTILFNDGTKIAQSIKSTKPIG